MTVKYSVLALMAILTVTGLNAAPHASRNSASEGQLGYGAEAASPDPQDEVGEVKTDRTKKQKVRRGLEILKPRYKVEMQATTANRWAAIRYDANTGQSWRMMDSTWLPIKELKQLRPASKSDYIVKIDHTENERYCALRMDLNSGQCWALKEGTWTPILEEE